MGGGLWHASEHFASLLTTCPYISRGNFQQQRNSGCLFQKQIACLYLVSHWKILPTRADFAQFSPLFVQNYHSFFRHSIHSVELLAREKLCPQKKQFALPLLCKTFNRNKVSQQNQNSKQNLDKEQVKKAENQLLNSVHAFLEHFWPKNWFIFSGKENLGFFA